MQVERWYTTRPAINGTIGPINRSAKDIEAKDIEAKDIWSHIQINGTYGPINVEDGPYLAGNILCWKKKPSNCKYCAPLTPSLQNWRYQQLQVVSRYEMYFGRLIFSKMSFRKTLKISIQTGPF